MTESKAKPKAKGTSRASKPRKSATKSKSPPKAGAKAKPGAEAKRATGKAASRLIDERIRSLGGWRAETLAEVRRLIHEADPDIVEECKWIKPTNPLGVPVWSHAGIVCTGETYKQVVKLTFARGASLEDPRGLFNSSLEGNTRRAIDIREGEVLDAEAFKALIQAAVAENLRSSAPKSKSPPKAGAKAKPAERAKQGQAGETPFRRQPADREGGRRRPGAGVHRRDAGLEARPREAPRRAHRADRAQRAQGREVELAVLRHRGPGLVPRRSTSSPSYVKVTFFRGTSLRPSRPAARRRARTRAGSTSTKTTSSTRRRWRRG